MKINQPERGKQRRRPFVGVAVVGAALAMGAVASTGSGTATAARDQAQPAAVAQLASVVSTDAAPINLTAQASPATVNYASPAIVNYLTPRAQTASSLAAADPLPVNRVKVRDALLRSQPTRNSTKLDVSQPGRGLTLYCWVPGGSGDGGLIWFRTHPWGSRYTGWMRADLVHWGSYPNPGRC
ncbi:hypothetical protein [Actinophytocola sp.]|uniref:hypothetical protein n=1 Tax=Actinophytocola sp. TaxID=1872138 RepID=UPI003899CFAA